MNTHSANPYGADQVRRSLIHFFLGKSSSALIGIGLLLLVVRALPAAEYGIYIALLAALEIIQLASNVGLFAAAYRYVPELRSQNRGHALHNLLLRLSALRIFTLIAVIAVIVLLVNPIAELLSLQGYEHVFVLYGFVVIAEGFARYLDILFDSLLLQRYSQIAILVRNGLRLIGLIFAIATTTGEVSLLDWVKIELMASIFGALLSAVMLFKYSISLKKNSPGLIKTNLNSRRYLVFAGSSYVAQVIGLLYGPETSKLILTKIGGVLQVGAFGFAASVSAMLQRYLPVFLLLGLVRPLFVSTHDGIDRNKRLSQLSNIVLKLNFFVLFPLIAFVLVSGNELASVMSGGKFPEAGNYLLIFMVLLVFQTWHAVLSLMTLALEDGVSGLHGTVLGLLGLLGGIALLPQYGTYSLGAGLVLSEIIWCAYVTFSLYRKGLTIENDWLGTAKIFIFSALGWGVSELLQSVFEFPQITTIILDLIVVSITFTFLSYLIKPFSHEERSLINKILPRPVFVW